MTNEERAALEAQITEKYRWYNTGSKMWSFAHHASLYLAAILSATSALVLKIGSLKIEAAFRNDTAAICAAAAALLATLASAGGFSRKWEANRIGRGQIEELQIDITAADADGARIRERLKQIIENQDRGVVGRSAPP